MGHLTQVLPGLARRPSLWWTAVRQWRALTPGRWWGRWPPVPGPAPDYLRFRLVTMYGSSGARLTSEELVGYLEWCRWMRAQAR
ncbi:MAG TPA: hypothetical protein VMF65_03855 [Acidimicrobiales bacterium]|nr:hypothetical protein [Acidimicrobiales bacterium]